METNMLLRQIGEGYFWNIYKSHLFFKLTGVRNILANISRNPPIWEESLEKETVKSRERKSRDFCNLVLPYSWSTSGWILAWKHCSFALLKRCGSFFRMRFWYEKNETLGCSYQQECLGRWSVKNHFHMCWSHQAEMKLSIIQCSLCPFSMLSRVGIHI